MLSGSHKSTKKQANIHQIKNRNSQRFVPQEGIATVCAAMFFQLDLLIGETWARLHGLEPLPIRWKAPGALKRPADIQVESRGAVYPTLGPKELQT